MGLFNNTFGREHVAHRSQDVFSWALFASVMTHGLFLLALLRPPEIPSHPFGAVFTREAHSPIKVQLQWLGNKDALASLGEQSPLLKDQVINHDGETRVFPQKMVKKDVDAQSASITPENSKQNAETVSGMGLPMQLIAGGMGGVQGPIGTVGEAGGRVTEDAQWAARQRSAYNYFAAFQQSLSMLPAPQVAMQCLVHGDGYDCNGSHSNFGAMLTSRLGFLYRIYPSFPAVQMRFEVGSGWIADLMVVSPQAAR